jgi:glycosyltransferase involved in cell wall biosynthesis
MRIALVVHQFPPEHVGGTEIHTLTLARALAERGHVVAVFYPSKGLDADRQETRQGLALWQAANPSLPASANPAHQFWRTFRNRAIEESFGRFLAAFRPDVVHFQHLQNVSGRLIAMAAGRPRVLTLHDYWYFCANSQLLRPDGTLCEGFSIACADCALSRLQRPLPRIARPFAALPLWGRNLYLRRALAQVDRFVAPSDYVKHVYVEQGLPSARIRVLPHGVSPARLQPSGEPMTEDAGRPLFGFLGSLAPAKGVHVLVEAFRDMPLTAGLVLYGDPTVFSAYVERLRRLATHPGVRFAGPVDHDQVGDALRQLDYVVVPSLWHETLCMVMDEAHALGVPVIASSLGALTRIEDGVNGRLFQAGDVAALRAILHELAASPELRARYAERLPAVPTTDQQTEKMLTLYTELLATP